MPGEETPQREPRIDLRRPYFSWKFLLLAVLIHASLLLVPVLRDAPSRSPQRSVQVWLETPPAEAEAEPAEVPVPTEPATRERQAAPPKQPPARPRVVSRTPEQPLPDAQAIRDSLQDFDWTESAEPLPPIGRLEQHDSYALLSRPLLPLVENLFDEVMLPATAEILDRWLEPGGAHRVVVRLPDGTVLCGRQEAKNDFRPWEQMPMMFGGCGGGGKR